jgi:serine protease
MLRRIHRQTALIITAAMLGGFAPVVADDTRPIRKVAPQRTSAGFQSTDRIIVRLHDAHDDEPLVPGSIRSRPLGAERSRSLSITAQTVLTPVRRMGSGAQVVRLTHTMALRDVEAIIGRLKNDPAVAFAEPDRRKFPTSVPSDPLYRPTSGSIGQWNLHGGPGGINAEPAWSITQGSPTTVIAILDTGLLSDLDFNGRTFTGISGTPFYGYDFIGADSVGIFQTANDADGRDADPSDPGNWINVSEAGQSPFEDCPVAESSNWHGTHTAGIIAANANNGHQISGIDWHAKIVPVRVLGKCGGYTSDIIDGLRWAAGLAVPGAPANTHPAHIINMSLGGSGSCSQAEQDAINEAFTRPQLKAIVSAAGNDSGTSLTTAPGNCTNVITVAATDYNGRRAPYSNGGANVAISAPGGYFGGGPAGVPADQLGILSLFNRGTTVPNVNEPAWVIGTSEAAAHTSGVIGLMLARNAFLTPFQVYAVLRRTALAFPDSSCTIFQCGSGILDAFGAVVASSTPPADQGLGFGGINQAPMSGAARPSTSTPSGGSGRGGCAMGGGTHPDWLLALMVIGTLVRVVRNKCRSKRVRQTR